MPINEPSTKSYQPHYKIITTYVLFTSLMVLSMIVIFIYAKCIFVIPLTVTRSRRSLRFCVIVHYVTTNRGRKHVWLLYGRCWNLATCSKNGSHRLLKRIVLLYARIYSSFMKYTNYSICTMYTIYSRLRIFRIQGDRKFCSNHAIIRINRCWSHHNIAGLKNT